MDIRLRSKVVLSIAFVFLFLGTLTASILPNSLLPKIDTPQIDLYVQWEGRSFSEIEQALIAPLELQLSDIENMVTIESMVFGGAASTTVKFRNDADMDKAYTQVLSRVNQIPGWPANVPAPKVVNRGEGGERTLATLFLFSETSNQSEQNLVKTYKEVIEPALRIVSGISAISTSYTPVEEKVDIEFDPELLARYSLTIDEVRIALVGLIDRSGGTIELGSREFQLHFKGQRKLSELNELPIGLRGDKIIRLSEIASIHTRLAREWSYANINGHRALYVQLKPDLVVSTLKTIEDLKETLVELNEGPLAKSQMTLTLSRDDSVAINSALKLLYVSVLIGLFLSSVFLYFYLRNWPALVIIFACTPVCLAMVSLLMYLCGRGLNVISLAGIAISVGLIMDTSIISIDSILRLHRQGFTIRESVTNGVSEVRGALISSTISSIIIFLPVLTMHSLEGQLFEDLAFTISSALASSLLAALFLVPALAYYLLKPSFRKNSLENDERVSGYFTKPSLNTPLRFTVLALGIPIALVVTFLASPSIDVLPSPKQRLVLVSVDFDEPMSKKSVKDSVADVINSRINVEEQGSVKFSSHGLLCNQSNCLLFFYPEENWNYGNFKAWIEDKVVNDIPDTRSYIFQGALLSLSLPNNRLTKLDLVGAEMKVLQEAGQLVLDALYRKIEGAKMYSTTPLKNNSVRIEFQPKQDQLLYYGLSIPKLNHQLVALTNGLYLGDFSNGSAVLPYYLKGSELHNLEQLLETEVMLDGHGLVPVRELTYAEFVQAPSSSLRINSERVVSLNLTPPEDVPVRPFVERVMSTLEIIAPTLDKKGVFIQYRGSADSLAIFLSEFSRILLTSSVFLLLLIWFALKSWRLSLLVMLSVPLAFAGGMLTLQFLNIFFVQNLDVITMIGFVVLMGLVVNNAILLASQYDAEIRSGRTQHQAIVQAIITRKRPIYMSAGTSIFGMLPLILNPGDGTEIYRGLAAVIIGGMVFSMLFSINFMSAALSLPMFAKSQKSELDR